MYLSLTGTLDIYLNVKDLEVPPGYLFFDAITFECEFDSSGYKTLLPEFTLLCINKKWLRYPTHTLPESFKDNVVHGTFNEIVAEGPIYGRCHVIIAIIGPFDSFGNMTFALEIQGCPALKFGLHCNNTCVCSDGVKCHNFNGECLCPKGLAGAICDIYEPILEVTSPYEYPTWESNVEINCTVHGLENAVIEWTKDKIRLPTMNSEIYAQYKPRPIQSTLRLYNVTGRNNGVYTCTVNTSIALQKTVTMKVIRIPNPFIEVPSNQTVKCGGSVTLTCRVKPEVGTIAWVKGREIPSIYSTLNNSDNIQIVENTTIGVSQLIITNVTLQDESIYRCYVGYSIVDDTIDYSESQIVVYVDPIEPFPRLLGNVNRGVYEVEDGGLIDLKCETNLSKPIVELEWVLDASFVKPFKSHTAFGGSLFNVTTYFSKTASKDDNNKEVMCVATSPGFGKRNISIILNITYTPIVNVNPESIKIDAKDDVLMTCNASANPTPISYMWSVKFTDGRILYFNTENLELNDVTTDFDKAVVICWANNSLGSSFATVGSFVVVGPGPRLDIIIPTMVSGVILLLAILFLLTYKHRYVVQTFLASRYIRIFQPDQGKEYDCYISYKSDGKDEDFVVRSLTPWLEQKGCTVCVDYKCFLLGDAMKNNITNFISKSRTIVIVLSPSFFKCNWCNYELKTAYFNFHEGRSNILPIVYEDIPDDAKTNFAIKTLFKSITYLTWPGDEVEERAKRRFWRDVDNSLGLQKNYNNRVANENEEGSNLLI
ncbi:uncharacterized protein LOC117107496 [Anneissia japonica]|uniref:uncharacterized protein LOC117107496 n=1 Tax=Anneissia japonica TaxID=1529436 RepID=UPI0014257871|nr:uncharacterized protein LOC117107496 [Anneissia japonica]